MTPERESPESAHHERIVGLIVVDAANVVGSRPDGWWRDRPGAARRLLDKLTTLGPKLSEPVEIVVVLEGAARRAMNDAPPLGDLQVVLADHEGDDTIVEVVKSAATTHPDRPITVITADRALRDRIKAHGAEAEGPRWLWNHLDQ